MHYIRTYSRKTIIFLRYVCLDVKFVHRVYELIIIEKKSSNVEVGKRLTTQKRNSKYFKKQSNNHVQKQYQPRFYEQNLKHFIKTYQNSYKKTANLELIMQ